MMNRIYDDFTHVVAVFTHDVSLSIFILSGQNAEDREMLLNYIKLLIYE